MNKQEANDVLQTILISENNLDYIYILEWLIEACKTIIEKDL